MGSNNSPKKVLSRLIHRGSDYFRYIPEIDMELWKPKIMEHIEKCQHPLCKSYKENANEFT